MTELYALERAAAEKNENSRLIFLIHGYGSNEEDLFGFAPELPANDHIISLRAPYDLYYGSFAWYAINFDANENKFSDLVQAAQSRDLLKETIERYQAARDFSTDRTVVIGFSQGAILSYALALSYPETVPNIAALSGYLNTEIVLETRENSFEKTRIFASHGIVDQVIPIDWARKAPEKLTALGIRHEFHEYAAGHGVAPQNFFDLLDWLKKV